MIRHADSGVRFLRELRIGPDVNVEGDVVSILVERDRESDCRRFCSGVFRQIVCRHFSLLQRSITSGVIVLFCRELIFQFGEIGQVGELVLMICRRELIFQFGEIGQVR